MKRVRPSLAIALLFAAPLALAGSAPAELWGSDTAAVCQPEIHSCLEKLASRLQVLGGTQDWSRVEQVLLELHETDPVCALLLREARARVH